MKYILFIAGLLLAAPGTRAQCPNGDVEMGTFVYWKGFNGSHTDPAGLDLTTFSTGFLATRHTVMSGVGTDALVPSIPIVGEGNAAFRIGNSGAGSQADIMSYTFTLTPDFSFIYAAVIENAHASTADPDNYAAAGFFRYWISLSSNLSMSTAPGNLLISRAVAPNPSSPDPYFKEWSKVCPVNMFPSQLGPHVGQTVTIYFASADCVYGGHYGYAYVDGLCKPNVAQSRFTAPSVVTSTADPITVDGGPSLLEEQYYWKIVKVTATGTEIAGTTVYWPSTAPGTPATGPVGTFDIKPYYSGYLPINDNDRLKVSLYTNNCLTGWGASTKTILIDYP